MIQEKTEVSQQVSSPSLAKIAIATLTALIIAAIVLVVAVLPAEYGIDPLGTGKALGLNDLATASLSAPAPIPEATIAPALGPPAESSRWGVPGPTMMNVFISQPNRYKIDSREMKLAPGEGMEIKYNMKKGAGLIFSWIAEKAVLTEFHGVPNVKPQGKEGTDYYESYELDDKVGKDQSHGTFIAPSTGIHGWFWENTSKEPVTVKLVSAGFYDWIQESRNEKQRAIDAMDPK